MICRNCQAKIADKAIVCYRCGTPTAESAPAAVPQKRRTGSALGGIVVALLLLIVWWLAPGQSTDPLHLAIAGSAALAFLVSVVQILRSRR